MKRSLYLFGLLTILFFAGCKKNAPEPPVLVFKTGAGFVSTDIAVNRGDSFDVGIVADKKDRDLKVFYVDYAYDGTSLGTNYSRNYIPDGERDHYEKTVHITARNSYGNERWIFRISDSEGVTATLEINVRTQ